MLQLDGTMVYHDFALVETAESVPTVGAVYGNICVTQTYADVSHDHIVGFDIEWIVGDADAVARCGLSCNSHVRLIDWQCRSEVNGT